MSRGTMLLVCAVSLIGAVLGGAGSAVAIWWGHVMLFAPERALDVAGNAFAGGIFGGVLCIAAMIILSFSKNLRKDAGTAILWLARLTLSIGLLLTLAIAWEARAEIFAHTSEALGLSSLMLVMSLAASITQWNLARLLLPR